jgi:hypothetical protein
LLHIVWVHHAIPIHTQNGDSSAKPPKELDWLKGSRVFDSRGDDVNSIRGTAAEEASEEAPWPAQACSLDGLIAGLASTSGEDNLVRLCAYECRELRPSFLDGFVR